MAEAVVVIFDVAQHFAAGCFEYVSGQFFGGRLSRTPRNSHYGPVPFEINAVSQSLKCGNSVVNKN